MKLNQNVAITQGVKSKAEKEVTALHHANKKPELFNGFVKHYNPIDEDGETLASEKMQVRMTVGDAMNSFREVMSAAYDAVATQDNGNTQARADIVVDGVIVLADVPVTYLMYLEKQLVDLRTFVAALPVLDDAYEWTFDYNASLYKTEPTKAVREKKVAKPVVLYEATEHHPAQVQLVNDSVAVGTWETVKTSGAIPVKDKRVFVKKVETLQKAVKIAREEANSINIEKVEYADKLFDFVFGDSV